MLSQGKSPWKWSSFGFSTNLSSETALPLEPLLDCFWILPLALTTVLFPFVVNVPWLPFTPPLPLALVLLWLPWLLWWPFTIWLPVTVLWLLWLIVGFLVAGVTVFAFLPWLKCFSCIEIWKMEPFNFIKHQSWSLESFKLSTALRKSGLCNHLI